MAIGGQINRYQTALAESQTRYRSMIEEMKGAKEVAAEPISPELKEQVDIYRTGGEYGAGAKGRIQQTAKENLAATQAELVATGMSSGSAAMGARARYSRDVTAGIQDVEDIRYERLSSALQAVDAAKSARGVRRENVYATTAQLMQTYQPPTPGQFASQEDIAIAQNELEERMQKAGITSAEKISAAQKELSEKMQAGEIASSEKMGYAGIASAQNISKRQASTARYTTKAQIESAANLQASRYSSEAALQEAAQEYKMASTKQEQQFTASQRKKYGTAVRYL